MNDGPSPADKNRQELLEALLAGTAPTESETAPPVSDELDHLLWLYAEEALTEAQEQRMWELAAHEPGVAPHFRKLVARLEHHSAAAEEPIPERVWARLGLPENNTASAPGPLATPAPLPGSSLKLPSSTLGSSTPAPLEQRLVDVAIRVANEFFQWLGGGQPSLSLAGMARGNDERHTTFLSPAQLRSTGIYKIAINHVGQHRCDVGLLIDVPGAGVAASSLQVELRTDDGDVLRTEVFENQAAWFRQLSPGRYALVLRQAEREVDRFTLDLEPESAE